MGLGFGSNRKAARLEVEVAGNTEDFDKSMAHVRRESKQTGEAMAGEFSRTERIIRGTLRASLVGLVIMIKLVGVRVLSDVGVGFAQAFGAKNLARIKAFGSTMRGLATAISSSIGPAIAGAASKISGLAQIARTSSAFQFLAKSAASVGKFVGSSAKTIATFTRIVSGPALKAVTRFSGVVSRALFGAFDLAALGARGLGKGLKSLGTRLREEGKLLSAFGIALQGTGSTLEKVGKTVGKVIGLLVKFKAGTVIATSAILGLSAASAGRFSGAFARVQTLLEGLTDGEIQELKEEVQELAREMGVASDELNNTFYQTLSAMPQLVNDAAGALEILKVATTVATTGFSDGETAIRAITGIMNAWKLETSEAIDVADALFAAQNQGVTTFGEIAESIGSVTSLTASLGGEWRDLLAIVATVSPFISTSEVLTGIASVEQGILNKQPDAIAAAKKLELDFTSARVAAIGLLPFIEEVIEKSKGDADIITALFGRKEAQNLVIALAGNMEELASKTEEVNDSFGKTAAISEIMENTTSRASERMGSAFDGLLTEMGQGIDQIVIDTKDGVSAAINELTKLFDEAGNLLDDLVMGSGRLGESLAPEGLQRFNRNLEQTLAEGVLHGGSKRRIGPGPAQPIGFGLPGVGELLNNPLFIRQIKEELGLQPRTFDPIKGGFPEPASLADSQRIIAEMAAGLDAVNKIQLHLTGDTEAYEIATRNAQAAVNSLVISERRRLLETGLGLEVVNELMSSFAPIAEAALTDEAVAADNAKEALEGLLATTRSLAELGIGQFDKQSSSLRSLSSEYASLDAQLATANEKLASLAFGERELREETEDYIVTLHARRTAVAEQITMLQQLSPLIEGMSDDVLRLSESMTEAQKAIFLETLGQFTVQLESLTAAQEAYAVARRKFGDESEEAEIAERAVTAQLVAMKKVLRELQAALLAAGISLTIVVAALEALEAIAGGKGLDPEDEGSFWKWIVENISTVEGLARGLLAVGESLGVISDQAAGALGGVIDLAEGLGRIKTDPIGGAAQAIGGLVKLGSAIFGGGESKEEKDRKASLEKNTDRLRRLADSIDELRGVMFDLPGKLTGDTAEALVRGFFSGPQRATDSRGRGAGETDEQFNERVQQFLRDLAEGTAATFTDSIGTGGAGTRNFPQVTADLKASLEAAGITLTDLEQLADLVGVEIDQLLRLVKGQDLNQEQQREALEQAQSLLNGLTLGVKDFFDTIAGRLDLANRRIALFDIDKPIDQIQKLVDVIAASGTGLSEDQISRLREGDESLIQELFEQLVTSTGLFGDRTNLGEFTPQEFLDLLSQIESVADGLDEDGPDSTSFQEFKGITEVTANRLAGLLTTDVFWNEITAQNVRAIVSLLGGTPIGAEPSLPAPNFDPSRFPGPDISREPVTILDQSVTIADLNVEVVQANPDMDAQELATQVATAINTELGNGLRRQVRSTGGVTTRTVR